MAITKQMLLGNPTLKGLDEAVIAQIVAMSLQDENTVIAKKTAEHWERLDSDLGQLSGLSKPRESKSHDWMKKIFGDMKTELTTVKQSLETKTAEIQTLNEKIKAGGDSATQAQISKLTQDLKDEKGRYEALKGQVSDIEEKHKGELAASTAKSNEMFTQLRFAQAAQGRQLREGMSPKDFSIILNSQIPQIAGMYDMGVESINGRPEVVFRDKQTGLMINNPKNLQQPLTAEDLVDSNFQSYFTDKERTPMGINSQPGVGSLVVGGDHIPGNNGLDVSGVKSKVGLDERIQTHLGNNGLKSNDPDYHSTFIKVREEALTQLPGDLPAREPGS